MTAPNTTEAPAPATMDDAMGVILAETKAQHAAETSPTPERPRDEHGKFLPVKNAAGETVAPTDTPDAPGTPIDPANPAGSDASPESAAVPAEGAADGGAEGEDGVDIPDGYVAVEPLPEDKARAFKVFDTEGEIAPPNLTFKLTANGKERELSTDKLVAYAQMGVYNHEREQAMQATQQQAHQTEQRLQQVQQAMQERDQQIEQLLSNPEYLLRAQMAYEQMNTPEARAEQQRQQLEQERQQFQMQQITHQTAQFLDGEVAPALEQIAAALPEVSREELAARLYLAADRYRVNGLLTPQGYDPVRQSIINDLVPWAQQLHEHRSSGKVKPTQEIALVKDKAKADVQQAQVRAQKARAAATRALKPGGRAPADTQAEPVVRNFKDAEAAVIGRTIAAVRGG